MDHIELAVGAMAPQFTLPDHQGNTVSLSAFQGKQPVLLIFYPGDDTPGCTKQLCAIRDDWEKFRQHNVAVFGINHAGSESHGKFIKKYSLKNPLLIDTDKKVSTAYGATKKFFKAEIIKRSVVLIDKQGIIRYLKRGLPPDSEILEAVKSLS
jgi:thioredoxin-dependent peroxiredoxin